VAEIVVICVTAIICVFAVCATINDVTTKNRKYEDIKRQGRDKDLS
jgi:putative effector of murein hydrolase LrgA (UPF0299 family)